MTTGAGRSGSVINAPQVVREEEDLTRDLLTAIRLLIFHAEDITDQTYTENDVERKYG